ncbi:MAG: hypothetical protein LVQ96_04495 [Thermoplasmatales archaeon]|nr:hypothetical protein [Thermoplasmatales archaeon]
MIVVLGNALGKPSPENGFQKTCTIELPKINCLRLSGNIKKFPHSIKEEEKKKSLK